MTRPAPESADLHAFGLILEGYAPGAEVTVEQIRDDLEALQVRPTSLGGLFNAACRRGWLVSTERVTRSRKPSRRGGRNLIYIRTEAAA